MIYENNISNNQLYFSVYLWTFSCRYFSSILISTPIFFFGIVVFHISSNHRSKLFMKIAMNKQTNNFQRDCSRKRVYKSKHTRKTNIQYTFK